MFLIRYLVGMASTGILAFSVYAGSYEGYLIDSNGYVVTTPYGECVRSGSWNESLARPDCTHDLKVKAKVYFDLQEKLSEAEVSEATKDVLRKAIDIVKGKGSIGDECTDKKSCDIDLCSVTDFDGDDAGVKRYQKALSIMADSCSIKIRSDDVASEVNYLLDESVSYGNSAAMNAKGYLLVDGDLLGYKDFETAFSLFRMAADNGNKSALHNLGFMMEHGLGVDQSTIEAQEYYDSAMGYVSILRLKNRFRSQESLGQVSRAISGQEKQEHNSSSVDEVPNATARSKNRMDKKIAPGSSGGGAVIQSIPPSAPYFRR